MALPPPPPVLHPMLVHFTIALVPVAALFATWAAWRGEVWTRRAAYALTMLAALSAIVTVAAGFVDYFDAKPRVEGTAAFEPLETHEKLGVGAGAFVVGTAAVATWKRARLDASPRWRWALAVALGAATLLVSVAALYGGSLVFDHGVGTRLPGAP